MEITELYTALNDGGPRSDLHRNGLKNYPSKSIPEKPDIFTTLCFAYSSYR